MASYPTGSSPGTSKHYDRKVVISGDMVELYEYERPIIIEDKQRNRPGRSVTAEEATRAENRVEVLHRAKRDVRRLVEANIGQWGDFPPIFATFTFAENVTDLDQANREWRNFVQRLNYQVTGEKKATLKYLVVVEFQKRGAVHYHAVFFNLPYIPVNKVRLIWGKGFVKLNRVENVERVGSYVSKYMTKDQADERLEGEKSYFTARGLNQPIEIKEEAQADAFVACLPGPLPEPFVIETEHFGKLLYRQIRLGTIN